MRCASDKARKRPAVAVDSAADASEVKAVTLLDKFRRAFGIDRDVRHQCAPDCFLARIKYCAPDPAARSVCADQDLRVEDASLSVDAHVICVLNNVEYSIAL